LLLHIYITVPNRKPCANALQEFWKIRQKTLRMRNWQWYK